MNKPVLICLLWVFGGAFAMAQTPAKTPNYDVPLHGHGHTLATPQGRIYYETEG